MNEMPKAPGAFQDRRALLDLIAGKWLSQAVSVCAELGIADILKDGPRSADEIATIAGASADAMFRLLRALASVGLLSSEGRRFALTASGNYLRSDVPGSLRGWARFVGHPMTWRPWGDLAHSVRTGTPAFETRLRCPDLRLPDPRPGCRGRPERRHDVSEHRRRRRGRPGVRLLAGAHARRRGWWRALQILRNCQRAMRPNGTLLLVDFVLRAGDEQDFGKFADLEMLVLNSGGRERTELESRDLLAKAGFRLMQIVPTGTPKSVIEAVRW